VAIVWVNLVVEVPWNLCGVISNKPPSIDEFNIKGSFIDMNGISTDVLVLRFYPVCPSFDFGW
jgi:hypothetical protein